MKEIERRWRDGILDETLKSGERRTEVSIPESRDIETSRAGILIYQPITKSINISFIYKRLQRWKRKAFYASYTAGVNIQRKGGPPAEYIGEEL